jgi:hypothetical protein
MDNEGNQPGARFKIGHDKWRPTLEVEVNTGSWVGEADDLPPAMMAAGIEITETDGTECFIQRQVHQATGAVRWIVTPGAEPLRLVEGVGQ